MILTLIVNVSDSDAQSGVLRWILKSKARLCVPLLLWGNGHGATLFHPDVPRRVKGWRANCVFGKGEG